MSINVVLRNCIIGAVCSIFAIVSLGVAGYSQTSKSQANANQLIAAESKAEQERNALAEQAYSLFKAKKYDQLEKLAEDLRKSKRTAPNGHWFLDRFYKALKISQDASDEEWQKSFADFTNWVKARPNSVTARIAYADAMLDYAWKGRTSGWAQDVKSEQWKMFSQRLANARQVLTEAGKLPKKCPHWYSSMLILGLGENWDSKDCYRIFNASIQAEPKYHTAYFRLAYYLTPRWHGQEGEWQKFAKESADRVGGINGDKLYAEILWDEQKQEGSGYREEFNSGKLSWERAKKGFQAILAQFPGDIGPQSEFCTISVFAVDQLQAKNLFKQIGNKVDLDVWGTLDKFKQYRDWALATK